MLAEAPVATLLSPLVTFVLDVYGLFPLSPHPNDCLLSLHLLMIHCFFSDMFLVVDHLPQIPPCCIFVIFTPDEGYLFVLFNINNKISNVKNLFKHKMHHNTSLTCSSIVDTSIMVFLLIIQSSMYN